jgi:dTDP-4-dehydrorhamnose 3,5-epimerase
VERLLKLSHTPISGVIIAETRLIVDQRGAFSRLFCEDELAVALNGRRIVQANQSRTSVVGAVRGLHYQLPPHAEMKLVRCIKGRVWDVVVDLRAGSPSFLKWHAEELTSENARMLIIPEGCAHGFQVLEAESELLYLHTSAYAPEAEGGIRHDATVLNISWPIPVADLSERDRNHAPIPPNFHGITI